MPAAMETTMVCGFRWGRTSLSTTATYCGFTATNTTSLEETT
jgi:hypothetical protein